MRSNAIKIPSPVHYSFILVISRSWSTEFRRFDLQTHNCNGKHSVSKWGQGIPSNNIIEEQHISDKFLDISCSSTIVRLR